MSEEKINEKEPTGTGTITGEPPEYKITERLLPKFSIKRPVTVTMILMAVLVVGFISYYRIKLDLFPSGLSIPYMGVWVPYRDANPKEIEEQIVKPIEGELKTVKNNPERIKEVNKEVEDMGGKILAQYAILGPYDFINIIETVGNTTITKIALEISSRGTLQSMTLAAIPIDDLIASWQ